MPQARPSVLPRILLVEDHDMTRRMQIRFLSRSYAVDFASTGEEAVDLALEHDYSAIIIDIGLAGGMTGVDVMRTLKHTPAHRGTAMVAVTGYSAVEDRERLVAAGFDLYLAKPFRWQEFTEVVRLAVRLSAEGHVQAPPPLSEPLPYAAAPEPKAAPSEPKAAPPEPKASRPSKPRAARPEAPHMGDGLAKEVAAHTTVQVSPPAAPPTGKVDYAFLTWQPLHAL